jgi:hypothetical protein
MSDRQASSAASPWRNEPKPWLTKAEVAALVEKTLAPAREALSYDHPATATAAREEVTNMETSLEEVNGALAVLIDKTLRDVEVVPTEDGEGERWKLRLTATDGTEVVLGTQDSDGYQSWLVLEAISA